LPPTCFPKLARIMKLGPGSDLLVPKLPIKNDATKERMSAKYQKCNYA